MAIYGIGAYYDVDVTKDFLKNNCLCIGYGKGQATSLYEMLSRAKIGDIIYIKSFTPRNKDVLYVKAIGILTGSNIEEFYYDNMNSMGYGREVKWLKDFSNQFATINLSAEDKVNNVYSNTMYEEYSVSIFKQLLNLLII